MYQIFVNDKHQFDAPTIKCAWNLFNLLFGWVKGQVWMSNEQGVIIVSRKSNGKQIV